MGNLVDIIFLRTVYTMLRSKSWKNELRIREVRKNKNVTEKIIVT